MLLPAGFYAVIGTATDGGNEGVGRAWGVLIPQPTEIWSGPLESQIWSRLKVCPECLSSEDPYV